MVKNALLILSLLVNLLAARVAYVYYFPATGTGPKMSCDEARSDDANKAATAAFAQRNSGSLVKTHEFLKNSDYELRNISEFGGTLTFVYTADSYPSTCGAHLPGLKGSIVRVRTDGVSAPLIKEVD